MSVYLDTSAVIPLFVLDRFTERAKSYLRSQPALVISDFCAAEFASMVGRRVRARELTQNQANAAFASFDGWQQQAVQRVGIESADIRTVEKILRRLDLPLRAPDALHIVVAQRLGAELVTFDEKMAACARALGAPVVAI